MTTTSNTPAHTAKRRLDALVADLRSEIPALDDPQAKALFETAAETLDGLAQAFEDYTKENEEAWGD